MKVAVRFFASIREAVGLEREEFKLHEGSSVRDLLVAVRETHPGLRDVKKFLIAVNGVRSKPDRRLREGDIVVFFPPVSGG